MNIRIHPSALRETRWHEYLIRFVLGGLATVATGAIANVFGPATGGLFLAFPAIFCASATLIEKHERERKEKVGLRGTRRGKEAADARRRRRRPRKLWASRFWRCDLAASAPFGVARFTRRIGGLVCRLSILMVDPTMDMDVATRLGAAPLNQTRGLVVGLFA